MKTIIDIENWKRKEHYSFFKDSTDPFFGLTANVDCTKAYRFAKENNLSFFLYYMHKSLLAINAVEEFKYRIEENKVVRYNEIQGSTTAMNADNLFAFAFLPYIEELSGFITAASEEIEKVKTITGMNLGINCSRSDVIHYSTIPWISFTAIRNERNANMTDSIPKINFGKYRKEGDKLLLPMSIDGHHALMDGYHAGQYFEIFQTLMNEA